MWDEKSMNLVWGVLVSQFYGPKLVIIGQKKKSLFTLMNSPLKREILHNLSLCIITITITIQKKI
jgi:hypothetical protein